MKRLFSMAVLTLCVSTGMASAKGLTYECKMSGNRSKGGAMPAVLFIGHETGADTATVSDPIILHFNKKPVTAKLVSDSAKRITFKWHVNMKNSKGQKARMNYRASVLKANNQLSMSAKPLGYGNGFNGVGSCVVKALKK